MEKTNQEVVRGLKVDLWCFRFNDEDIGIRQKAQLRSDKDLQWSKDMDPLGHVIENREKIRLLGVWKKTLGAPKRCSS